MTVKYFRKNKKNSLKRQFERKMTDLGIETQELFKLGSCTFNNRSQNYGHNTDAWAISLRFEKSSHFLAVFALISLLEII